MSLPDKSPVSKILERMEDNWPEAAIPETKVMLGIIRLNDIVAESTAKVVARFGLTPAAFEVLVTLRSLPPPRQLTPTELCRSILLTSGGMTKVLNQLVAVGLISHTVNPRDRRSKLVKLTAKGARQAERAMQAVSANDIDLLSPALSRKQIATLGRTLLDTLDNLERA